jgi:hypothetical protein
MCNKFHDQLTGSDVHVIHSFTYADATTRNTATGLTVDDEGKVAKQEDDKTFWVLVDHTGPTWKQLTNGTPTTGSTHDPNQFYRWVAAYRDNPLEIYGRSYDWAVNEAARKMREGATTPYMFAASGACGLGTLVYVPETATSVTLRLRSKSSQHPGPNGLVGLAMYWRRLGDGELTEPWGARKQWNNVVTLPDNKWHYHEATRSLASQNVRPGSLYLFELVREGNGPADSLSSAWLLISLEMQFNLP